MLRALLVSASIVVVQAGPYAQARGRAAAPRPRDTTVRVTVRTPDGTSIDGAHLTLSGDRSGEFSTAGAGLVLIPNLADGTYRIHCEKDGFVTLEREFAVKGGTPSSIELVLTPQPAPPPPPPPKPAAPAADEKAAGQPVSVVITDFIDKNFIGREPIKESVLACTSLEVVRLLQVREAIGPHAHAEGEESIYVVAGEGAARIGAGTVALKPSSLIVVPRHLSHQIERRGKNPLILISTLAGEPCAAATPSK